MKNREPSRLVRIVSRLSKYFYSFAFQVRVASELHQILGLENTI